MRLGLGSAVLALTVGLAIHGGGFALAQQVQPTCDQNDKGASSCSDVEPGATTLTAERLLAETGDGSSMETLFKAIDQDRDGVISRAEWLRFTEQRAAGAPGQDHAGWRGQALQR